MERNRAGISGGSRKVVGMDRRKFLSITGATLSLASVPELLKAADSSGKIIKGGWVDLPVARKKFIAKTSMPLASQHGREIVGSSRDKAGLLWKAWEEMAGHEFVPHFQEIGDCVSQGGGLGVEVLSATEIVDGQNETWCGKISTEVLYGGSRVEVGGGQLRGDGSTGAWLAEFLEDFGTVKRGKYGNIDLTKYDPELAKEWGKRRSQGIPREMETLSKEHPVKRAVLIDGGFNQACDFMANGCPIVVCSSVGFRTQADRDGFLYPGPQWMHCMLVFGFDRKSRREGGCIANSWGGNWVSGPAHRLGTPAGCFWAEARTLDRMFREGDSYALMDYQGFEKKKRSYILY